MSKNFTKVRILFIVVGLLLALIPTSALASEIQPLHSSSISQNRGLEKVTETGPGVVYIQGIYLKHPQYFYSIWPLEGEVLASGSGMIEVLVGWFNDSGSNVTGHIKATVTKPDGNTVSLEVIADQDTTLSSGESVVVNLTMFIDRSGPWVLDAQLTDFATGQELDKGSASFTVAGISTDFEGDPRVCDTPPCCVNFTNRATGGALPYTNAVWDFGDRTLPTEGEAVNNGEIVAHCYSEPGVFDVTLRVWDTNGKIGYHGEAGYIVVGEGGPPALEQHTWAFSTAGFFPKHLPDSYIGSVVLKELGNIPPEVQGVYYNDFGNWKFWAPGAPDTTLATLGGGLTYDYAVVVAGNCEWDIPLP